METKVNVWEQEVLIPTYSVSEPEKNPMFLENRIYQGSSGVVYPYPVVEKIDDKCEPKAYNALFLENEYLKIMILPELGGRVQMAYDKIGKRHFVYYNQVIKPALVGLTGPWISGGIEFNWPQHHRPSTFMPIDYTIEQLEDGSAIVWVSERERMFHQKGMAGFKLSPGRAVLEIEGKLYNPTPMPQTFLWWANPAVAVNDHYQSVFPEDVNAVFDHGKRDVSEYPIAHGTYYKMDYSSGVDISRYKNIPVPTSYMAVKSTYDFIGGYENDTRAGILHIADHNYSPGKKQWTWGNGDFGQAWDRNLTDEDGPYIELMTGVYTDNQPDFSWLQPYEQKSFVQYFMPYRELGVVKNASVDLMLNIEPVANGCCLLKVFATSLQRDLTIRVMRCECEVITAHADVCPEQLFELEVPMGDLEGSSVHILRSDGQELLSWRDSSSKTRAIPDAAKAAPRPEQIETAEELFLWGLHLEQYRHATYDATEYYQEAIRRFPNDVRCNNALGLRLMRKGRFEVAEPYLRRAVEVLTMRNPNPYDGEPLYNLGLVLRFLGRDDEAYDLFCKSCWNAAWQDSGYFSAAQISSSRNNWHKALDEIDKSLVRNWNNHRARHLKSMILRKLGRESDALALIEESLAMDKFNFGCLFERQLITGSMEDNQFMHQLMRNESHNYEELILDYSCSGSLAEALCVADAAIEHASRPSPMVFYYRCWILIRLGETKQAFNAALMAEKQMPECCFPNHLDAIAALKAVAEIGVPTPKAYYYLGNLWYDKRQHDLAIAAWESSVSLDDTFPTVLRNLSLAYFNKRGWSDRAVETLERAFALDNSDSRIFMELDQLYKRLNRTHAERLSLLSCHMDAVDSRDDLYLEYATLLNQTGCFAQAIKMIECRKFHPWEGGEGKVTAQYQIAKTELAKQHINNKEYGQALVLLNDCLVYPDNLGEGKLYGARENDFDYLIGVVLESEGRVVEARAAYQRATVGNTDPSAAIYYNDQKPDKIFYQGLALLKLDRKAEAVACFEKLIAFGEEHLDDVFEMDYFAVSLPDLLIWDDDMDKRNKVHCHYLIGLGHLGMGNTVQANVHLEIARSLDINNQGVQIHLQYK